jgi:deazaflavin-dependent oxidoreductase (nitroreductase family)
MSNPPSPRAQTLALQPLVNRVVRVLLRTPLICRGIGRRLITVYVVGRKSGRRYAIPVAYTQDGNQLLIGSPFPWARNLRTSQPVEIRLKGTRRQTEVEVFTAEDDVTRLYATMCRDNRQFAKFNKIRLDPAGNPDPDDLHSAWTAGARAFRLTPR